MHLVPLNLIVIVAVDTRGRQHAREAFTSPVLSEHATLRRTPNGVTVPTLFLQTIIERFGRYPHRNKVLGRESTPEELTYLQTADAYGQ